MKGRLQWADAARGIAIMLVILGHTCPPPYTAAFIYAFHMPLFFLLSGLFMQEDMSWRSWWQKRVRTLLVPFVIFNIVLLVSDLCIVAISPNGHAPIGIPSRLMGTLTGWRSAAWPLFQDTPIHAWSSSLWFLPALFMAQALLLLIYKLTLGKTYKQSSTIIVIIISFAGIIYADLVGLPLPMSLDAALVASVFLLIGHKLLQHNFSGFPAWFWVVSGILFMVTALHNFSYLGGGDNHVDMYTNTYGLSFNFYIAAITGSLLLIWACYKWEGRGPQHLFHSACWLGRNSLCIYCLHRIPLNLGIAIWNAVVRQPSAPTESFTLVRAIVLFTFTLLLIIPIVYIVNRWFPWTLRKKT